MSNITPSGTSFWNFAVQAAKDEREGKFEYVKKTARGVLHLGGLNEPVFNNAGFVDGYAVVELAGLFFFVATTMAAGPCLYVSFDKKLRDRFPVSSAAGLGELLIRHGKVGDGERP